MARRIDFHDDPDAPVATVIVPSVNVAVTNDAGDLLLIRRTDNGNWALPGGGVDIGESVPQAAVRETKEESGIDCEITGLSGIYTDPGHVILYTSNGEVRQEFSVVLTARRDRWAAVRQQRDVRSPVGPARRREQLPDGPVDENASRAPPGRRRPAHRLTGS